MSNDTTMVPFDQPGKSLGYKGESYVPDIDIDGQVQIKVMQGQSPEVLAGLARPGEILVRPNGVSLGSKFVGIIVAFGKQFSWFSEESDVPIRTLNSKSVPAELLADTLFPNSGGNKRADGKNKPVATAQYTAQIVVLDAEGNISKPAYFRWASMSYKTGENVFKILRAQATHPEEDKRVPMYACVFTFEKEFRESDEGGYFILKANPLSKLTREHPLVPKLAELHRQLQPQFNG